MRPKLTSILYYAEKPVYGTMSTPSSLLGLLGVIGILFFLIWRYQTTSIKKVVVATKQQPMYTNNNTVYSDNVNQQLQNYMYHNTHPQHRLQQVLLQNHPMHVESYIDEP
tara:strand:- start:637 stop:966 length:330 start_codon:yes stop_codon:yes gene_type:complete